MGCCMSTDEQPLLTLEIDEQETDDNYHVIPHLPISYTPSVKWGLWH